MFQRLYRASFIGIATLALVGAIAACGSPPPLVQPGNGATSPSAGTAGSSQVSPSLGTAPGAVGVTTGSVGASSPRSASGVASFSPAPAIAGQAASLPRGITVTGVGRVKVRPDQALVSTGVETHAPTAQDAQAENNRQMQAVLAALKGMNIPDTNIQTSGLSLFPVTDQNQKVTGYNARNQVTVRIDAIDQAGAVLDAAVKAGANQIGGVQFTLKDETISRNQALGDATKDARAKADALAKALGLQITDIQAIAEASTGGVEYIGPRVAAAPAAGSAPIEPGEIAVSAQVTIVYGF